MSECKICFDTIYSDYDTCMSCYEKQNTKLPMTNEDYQRENANLNNILQSILYEIPEGFMTNRTYNDIPRIVQGYVKDNASFEEEEEAVEEMIKKSMPNFFYRSSMIQNVAILLEMAYPSHSHLEELEALRGEIRMTYEYYAGFGVGKDLTTTQMLNHILKTVPNYKPTELEHDLEDMKRHCDHYIKALEEISKKNRKAETCRMIALKALGELDSNNYQPELLIEDNLALRMKVEDLECKLIGIAVEKVFPLKSAKMTEAELDNLIARCIPGGDYCDPQEVADAIRSFFKEI